MPSCIPARDSSSNILKPYKYIPRKIFQTWESSEVTPSTFQAANAWVTHNSNWEYNFYNEIERRGFIKNNFSISVLNAYDALIPGAYKADLWRYCILYVYGGVYADIKIIPCTSLDDILELDTEFTSAKERHGSHHLKGAIWNTFICSKPQHPFLKRSIDKIVDNVVRNDYGKNALYPTGPFLLGNAINEECNRKNNSDFKLGKQKLGGNEFTLWYVPKQRQSKDVKFSTIYTNKNKDTKCFLSNYPTYREEKIIYTETQNKSYDYAYCWRNFSIYASQSNNDYILYPILKQIKYAYKKSNLKQARKLIAKTIFERHQFHWKLARYFFAI